jgi:hypothetical protein
VKRRRSSVDGAESERIVQSVINELTETAETLRPALRSTTGTVTETAGRR